ncbi:MAG: hypothetical protein KBB39_01065 [Phycicoccus sp.]|nr:hypothetical protein [Phycicoccus sp.]
MSERDAEARTRRTWRIAGSVITALALASAALGVGFGVVSADPSSDLPGLLLPDRAYFTSLRITR